MRGRKIAAWKQAVKKVFRVMDFGFGAVTILLFVAYLVRKLAEKALIGEDSNKRPIVDVDFTEVPNEHRRRPSNRPAYKPKGSLS